MLWFCASGRGDGTAGGIRRGETADFRVVEDSYSGEKTQQIEPEKVCACKAQRNNNEFSVISEGR